MSLIETKVIPFLGSYRLEITEYEPFCDIRTFEVAVRRGQMGLYAQDFAIETREKDLDSCTLLNEYGVLELALSSVIPTLLQRAFDLQKQIEGLHDELNHGSLKSLCHADIQRIADNAGHQSTPEVKDE